MFGLDLFKKTKTKKLSKDKDRKRYFAIKQYYKNKKAKNKKQSGD